MVQNTPTGCGNDLSIDSRVSEKSEKYKLYQSPFWGVYAPLPGGSARFLAAPGFFKRGPGKPRAAISIAAFRDQF